jgi:hypothetical protein
MLRAIIALEHYQKLCLLKIERLSRYIGVIFYDGRRENTSAD